MKYLPLPGIYKITNLVNGKGYIGKSHDMFSRWIDHYRSAKTINDGKPPLRGSGVIHKAMNKYGIENFRFEMLLVLPLGIEITDSMLSTLEIFFIADQDTYIDDGKGYNMTKGGEGIRPSLQTRQKMSKSNQGSKNGFFGKHHTQEAIEKNRKSHQGICNLSEDQIKQYSIRSSGKGNPFYGKTHSEKFLRQFGKPILCVETGRYYRSSGYAGLDTNQLSASIYQAARLGTRSGGFHWKFITWEEFDLLKSKYPLLDQSIEYLGTQYQTSESLNKKRIDKYVGRFLPVQCVETGKVYISSGEASKLKGITNTSLIPNAIKRKCRAGGFHWKYTSRNEYLMLRED